MLAKPTFDSVAWVPWSWNPDEARAAGTLAMQWVLGKAVAARSKPVLRVHSNAHTWRHPTSRYAPYARYATVVTDRGRNGTGPTLVPTTRSMRLVADGMASAYHHALVVEEHPALPLDGWADELRAINLRTGQPAPDHRPSELVAQVRTLTASL